ncbi:MAG: hypothetical protein KGO53_03945 [Alphaproteobacteria bacterium]|nr:hypothetical protein [Alphaproteobacteria bacterium]
MSEEKPKYTPGQKRLLALVYIMGGVLVALFVLTLGAIAWQLSHLH